MPGWDFKIILFSAQNIVSGFWSVFVLYYSKYSNNCKTYLLYGFYESSLNLCEVEKYFLNNIIKVEGYKFWFGCVFIVL